MPCFLPRQTWFRSYQKCCRGAGGRRKALLLACRRWPTPFPSILGPARPRVAGLVAAESPQCRVFRPAKPGFAAIRSAAGGQSPRAASPSPPYELGVASLVAAKPPQCRVFRPAKPGFAAIRSAAGGQSPRAASPSPPYELGVASLVAAKQGSAGPKSGTV